MGLRGGGLRVLGGEWCRWYNRDEESRSGGWVMLCCWRCCFLRRVGFLEDVGTREDEQWGEKIGITMDGGL